MNTYTMKEIKAREGYYLTQLNEVEDRIFITAIKGVNVNESDWREATEEEKNAYEEAQEAQEAQAANEVMDVAR